MRRSVESMWSGGLPVTFKPFVFINVDAQAQKSIKSIKRRVYLGTCNCTWKIEVGIGWGIVWSNFVGLSEKGQGVGRLFGFVLAFTGLVIEFYGLLLV